MASLNSVGQAQASTPIVIVIQEPAPGPGNVPTDKVQESVSKLAGAAAKAEEKPAIEDPGVCVRKAEIEDPGVCVLKAPPKPAPAAGDGSIDVSGNPQLKDLMSKLLASIGQDLEKGKVDPQKLELLKELDDMLKPGGAGAASGPGGDASKPLVPPAVARADEKVQAASANVDKAQQKLDSAQGKENALENQLYGHTVGEQSIGTKTAQAELATAKADLEKAKAEANEARVKSGLDAQSLAKQAPAGSPEENALIDSLTQDLLKMIQADLNKGKIDPQKLKMLETLMQMKSDPSSTGQPTPASGKPAGPVAGAAPAPAAAPAQPATPNPWNQLQTTGAGIDSSVERYRQAALAALPQMNLGLPQEEENK